MGKSALIVDTPNSCLHCKFCIKDLEYPQCKLDKALGGSYNTTWEKLDEIPEWCPLTKIPNRKDIDSHGYNAGWNDCVNEILGSLTV